MSSETKQGVNAGATVHDMPHFTFEEVLGKMEAETRENTLTIQTVTAVLTAAFHRI